MKGKKLVYTLCTLFCLISCSAVWASGIVCSTPRENLSFEISKHEVALYESGAYENERSVASVANVRTRKSAKGFTKILHFEGHKYTLHIENAKQFSDVNDYLIMRSPQGHEMTYPLTCSLQ